MILILIYFLVVTGQVRHNIENCYGSKMFSVVEENSTSTSNGVFSFLVAETP